VIDDSVFSRGTIAADDTICSACQRSWFNCAAEPCRGAVIVRWKLQKIPKIMSTTPATDDYALVVRIVG
jgi:hypothetical protein